MTDNIPNLPQIEKNNYTEIINKLQYDIKIKIYNDNFHIKHDCNKLIEWFNKNSSLQCSASEVEELTNKILESKEGIEYMKKKNKFFEEYYIQHFVDKDKKKSFIKMNNTQSFITCILMSMWH